MAWDLARAGQPRRESSTPRSDEVGPVDESCPVCNHELTLHTERRTGTVTRVQILLTEEQDRRLERLAQRLRTSKARLVREGVDFVLQHREARASDALLELVGQAGRVGRKDVSRRHYAYLVAAERNDHR